LAKKKPIGKKSARSSTKKDWIRKIKTSDPKGENIQAQSRMKKDGSKTVPKGLRKWKTVQT